MTLLYIKSNKGNDILVENGYMYYFESDRQGKTVWHCVLHKSKCRGRVHVFNDRIVKSQDHNHDGDVAKIEAKLQENHQFMEP